MYGHPVYWYKNVLGQINSPTHLWYVHTHIHTHTNTETHTYIPVKFVWGFNTMESEKLLNRNRRVARDERLSGHICVRLHETLLEYLVRLKRFEIGQKKASNLDPTLNHSDLLKTFIKSNQQQSQLLDSARQIPCNDLKAKGSVKNGYAPLELILRP